MRLKGSIAVFELAAVITGIMVIAYISSSFYDATKVKQQAAEGYNYGVKLADSVIEYYEDNSMYPSDNYNNYGVNPGNYVESVTYTDKTPSTHGYVLATFKNLGTIHATLKGKFILLRLEGSGGPPENPNHLVYRCFTNVNSSILDGGLQANNEVSQIVGNSCEIITAIDHVL